MDLGLTQKVALVTGASAGIGYSVAQKLAAEGCQLIICGRNSERLEQAYQGLVSSQAKVIPIVADVQNPSDSQKLVQETLTQFGKIDILVNNSQGATFSNKAVENLSDEDWSTVFEGKLMGYIRMTNLVLPTMKNQQWGRIINIVGTSGKEPSSRLVKSGVGNAALINFTKTVATEVAKWNVLVNCVNPGLIDTPRHREYLEVFAQKEDRKIEAIIEGIDNTIPIGRRGLSSEVANLVAFLSSECASYITGVTIPVDGGLSTGAF
ncbi:SDR family oxidoreductase [Nostoc sp. 'Peltigera membranacea cyanobiont' N6]|uniref:SDR family oxidoreductase n=1 Tax=Nostoc sp. 'Peltigera membranacea cyanobiont' N6 TaxID=1261031 RepID=UPI000CF34B45|nr:SDR family oxidoreductase [Nostoc sp. 'Peltigera membranacea cyanobiont' N6]AVH65364.1 short-chain dehydrogenase/reductase SDR [Nostoc sp. 'Peltigera membranacea cyanobiont' N6]